MFKYENPEIRRTSMSKADRAKALEARQAKSEAIAANTSSTAHRYALACTDAELYIRDVMYKRGVGNIRDFGSRAANVSDMWHEEIKCGGNLGRPAFHMDGTFDADDIYPHAKFIVWVLYQEVEDTDDLVDMSAIVPRDEFIAILERASRKGLHGTLRLKPNGKNGSRDTCDLVMAFQPTPLEKVRDAVREGLDSGEFISVRTWLQEHNRNGW